MLIGWVLPVLNAENKMQSFISLVVIIKFASIAVKENIYDCKSNAKINLWLFSL